MAKEIKMTFPVEGMSCAVCASNVEKALNSCTGVTRATVNFAAATANVEFNSKIITPQMLEQAVRDAGYELILRADATEIEQKQQAGYKKLKLHTILAIILSLPVFIFGMFFMHAPYADWMMLIFSTPVVFWLGARFFRGAWNQLRHRNANMDTLVALSTGIAWLFSVANMFFPSYWLSKGITPHVYFEASAVIIAFILLGKLMENKAKSNTSSAIRRLMGLRPETVNRVASSGEISIIPIEEVAVNDTLMVRPGERIAVDGLVTEGESYVDESMLSGEPTPVHKESGSKVFAGTINTNGSFRYTATGIGEETLLSQIIRLVQDAQGSKPPVQKLVDKIASIFVPVIISISIIAFIDWIVFDPDDGFSHGLLAAITTLVIACPCALGLATPTAIMVGMGKGAEMGILIKDAEALETAPHINAIVLDKTGTLTIGRPSVQHFITFVDNPHLLGVLRAMEQHSEHPIGTALAEYLADKPVLELTDFQNLPGMGISACHDGKRFFAGNLRLLHANGVNPAPEQLKMEKELSEDANSIIWFADTDGVIALAGISDRLREGSATAVSDLERMGIEVYMLTGDNRATAEAVARNVGIRHVTAGVLPEEKSEYILTLRKEGKKVAMVGDGINDSAALANANLSIAMGTGSDIAMEVAQMTIISSDLRKIPVAIRLSGATVRTIHRNLFWAFIYNIIGVPIAAGILYPFTGFLLNPMIAGAAMAFSSVSVVTNSLLLKRFKGVRHN